jgi:hypothetical protein
LFSAFPIICIFYIQSGIQKWWEQTSALPPGFLEKLKLKKKDAHTKERNIFVRILWVDQ